MGRLLIRCSGWSYGDESKDGACEGLAVSAKEHCQPKGMLGTARKSVKISIFTDHFYVCVPYSHMNFINTK